MSCRGGGIDEQERRLIRGLVIGKLRRIVGGLWVFRKGPLNGVTHCGVTV